MEISSCVIKENDDTAEKSRMAESTAILLAFSACQCFLFVVVGGSDVGPSSWLFRPRPCPQCMYHLKYKLTLWCMISKCSWPAVYASLWWVEGLDNFWQQRWSKHHFFSTRFTLDTRIATYIRLQFLTLFRLSSGDIHFFSSIVFLELLWQTGTPWPCSDDMNRLPFSRCYRALRVRFVPGTC